MRLDTLGIDSSVSVLFPPEFLAEQLSDLSIDIDVLDESVGTDGKDGAPATTCDAIVTFEHRESFVDLDWIHSIQAGVDRFPQDRLEDAGVALTNSTGIHGDAIGETVAGYLLAFSRRLHEHIRDQERREWSQPDWDEAWTIAGERACVVGLGSLGRGVVDRLSALGVDVDGVRRTPVPEPGVDRVHTPGELERAVADARFVVLTVPLTDETEGMIDRRVFDAMPDDAYLINVARGGVVDQSALVSALEAGDIAGAALDVFEREPLPETSALWEMDEVIVTPHCAAFTHRYGEHVASIVRENVRRARAGEALTNRVL
ncbi:D-2-hydroxyacid dehydrogenase [Halorubrum laminariae]|uniref:D-2-hydroxyacid dehydrogenase n=1 Tax=Halorubrum laminariae TaxID=1433523 RepID=A0ABD6BWB2_9EURY|nr:D-2-hydroxyacid dehydrogenase [Halorubrum laminariae]